MALMPALTAAAQALGLGSAGGASAAPIGSGLAAGARDTINARKAYNQHVLDAQTNGETPLSFEDFQKQFQGKRAPGAAAADLGVGQ